jgi:superoxide dismutase, Fe-Mn family
VAAAHPFKEETLIEKERAMPFQLPDLPFRRDALQPVMSAETLDYHHGKHHKAYVDKVNGFLADRNAEEMRLVDVVRQASDLGDKAMFNNAAQIWNHSFFWQCLAPAEGQQPSGKLKALIEEGFGGTDALLTKLKEEAVGHFSNGWAWLVLNRDKLEVTSLHDADTPLVYDGMTPLLTLDLWEHAYYVDYRNERPRYAEEVLSRIVNWEFVARNLDGEGAGRADQEPSASLREVEMAG